MSWWRGATAGLSAAAVLVTVSGCSGTVDQAHSVQTKLGRVDGVLTSDVAAPSAQHTPRISVTFEPSLRPADIVTLVADIAGVADEEEYVGYRLDLSPADGEDDVLVVDDAFDGSPDEATVVANWRAVTDAVLGPVTYSFQAGNETISVASGSAIVHDVTEVGRIGYGYRDTTWSFESGPSSMVVSGRMSPTDVELLQRVQRSVVSSQLPVPATAWRLERRTGHVLLDLDVALPGDGTVDPRQVSVARYGDAVGPLVTSALEAVSVSDLPVWLRLRHPTAQGDDVFGYWVSDQRPVRGRDRLDRGWDRWLGALARQVRG